MIVPDSLVGLARALAAGLSPGGSGMFTTGVSADGNGPATHWISSGAIGYRFAELITSADALYDACAEAGASVTLAQCNALVTQCEVSDGTRVIDVDGAATTVDEGPHEMLERLGLQLLQGALP